MHEAKPSRRPAQGGYARGEETRLRIIGAAIELFGERGFEAASTRDIAARAGVNAPALQYYFANKEGVYRACAEHIANMVWQRFEPVVQSATETLAANADIPALIEAFIAIQRVLAERMFLSPTTASQRLFFVREQTGQEPAVASEILQTRMRAPLNRVGIELVARIGGTHPDDPVTRIRLLTLHGQMMVFNVAPRSALVLLEWEQIDAEKAALVQKTIETQTRALLNLWNQERLQREVAGKTAPRAKRTRD